MRERPCERRERRELDHDTSRRSRRSRGYPDCACRVLRAEPRRSRREDNREARERASLFRARGTISHFIGPRVRARALNRAVARRRESLRSLCSGSMTEEEASSPTLTRIRISNALARVAPRETTRPRGLPKCGTLRVARARARYVSRLLSCVGEMNPMYSCALMQLITQLSASGKLLAE